VFLGMAVYLLRPNYPVNGCVLWVVWKSDILWTGRLKRSATGVCFLRRIHER